MIAQRIEELNDRFNKHSDWEDKYREIIKMGKSLDEMSEDLQIEKYKIKGCQSQVWLVPSYNDGVVTFAAWSDAVLVKGIIGMLVNVYSGSTPEDIMATKADFLAKLGVTDHLSMNRTNGLASMIKQIQMYAFVYNSLKDRGVLSANDI
jgi:cysteine desulfuration protein SufE